MYQIIVENKAVKEIDALPNDILPLVVDIIEALKRAPRPSGVKKLVGRDGWRVKVRTYRVLYTIDDRQKTVTIYRVKHRRDAYR